MPSAEVTVPVRAPLGMTLTPERALPSLASVTLPVIVLVWEKVACDRRSMAHNIHAFSSILQVISNRLVKHSVFCLKHTMCIRNTMLVHFYGRQKNICLFYHIRPRFLSWLCCAGKPCGDWILS